MRELTIGSLICVTILAAVAGFAPVGQEHCASLGAGAIGQLPPRSESPQRDIRGVQQAPRERQEHVAGTEGQESRGDTQAAGETEGGTTRTPETAKPIKAPVPPAACVCPDPLVHKNGHCHERYAIVFTAKWCVPCRRMPPVVDALRAKGFIVYYFDIDEFRDAARELNVRVVPETIVFRDGRVYRRLPGVVSAETIERSLTDE